MTIKPGILLNPLVLQNPAALTVAFHAAVAALEGGVAALREELSVIAGILQESGVDEGERLSDVVASPSPLAEYCEEIAECLVVVDDTMLARALEHSARRFSVDAEEAGGVVRKKRGRPRIWSDEAIEAAVSCAASLSEASRLSGIPEMTIRSRLYKASEDSLLAVYKEMFKGSLPRDWSEEEVEAAVDGATSVSEASRLSGISTSTIHNKINRASNDSRLARFKGKFKRGRR